MPLDVWTTNSLETNSKCLYSSEN